MVAAFSTPILSVAADAVRDLEGHDALFGLWAIFTKCKESLPNGARLENITWRLWYHELKGPLLEKASQITKQSNASEPIRLEEKSPYHPPTPSVSSTSFPPAESTTMAPEDAVLSFSELHSPPSYSPPRCPSENATSRRINTTSRGVGQIICDFLPTHHDVSSESEGAAPIYQPHSKTFLVAYDPTRPSTIRLPEVRSLISCLPTPDNEVGEPEPSIPRTATQSPSPLLNAPQATSTPGLLSEPPRLVVVNPTPNPTPQPTPPTTPIITNTASAMHGNGSRSLWLTPPRLARGPVSQLRYGGETAVGNFIPGFILNEPTSVAQVGGSGVAPFNGIIPSLQDTACIPMQPDHTDILPTIDPDFGQDHPDIRSGSSITSKSSECSHTTTSVAGASTTSASSTGYLLDGGHKASDLIGTTTGYTHLVGNLPLATLQRLNSLSSIQSISTDRGRKVAVPSSDIGDAKDSSSGIVTAAEDEAESEMIRKGKPSNRSRVTFPSKKRGKRNSAPVSTSNPPHPTTSHVDQSPHHFPAVPLSTEHPTTPEATSQTATNDNSVMNPGATNDHSSSQSRSSSVTGSRSRSRGQSGNPFADLSGIGTLGGYTIAAAYPPPNMTVRKQVVGAGKGKVKLGFGRGLNGKSKAVRRNSAGSATDVGAKEKDKGGNRGSGAKLEKVKSVEHEQILEDILEKSTLDEPQERKQILTHEEKVLQALTTTANPAMADPVSRPIGELIQSIKRQPRFNIGSNSDDGSGIASKSAGSGSSQSGGHSLGQRAGKLMEESKGRKEALQNVMNQKKLDALLLEEQERQRQIRNAEMQHLELQQHKHHNAHAQPLQPPVTSPKPAKHDTRHSKATQPAHNVTHAVLERVRSSSRASEIAKGRTKAVDHHHHHAVPTPTSKQPSKTKAKSTTNLGSLDPVLAAKVRDSLGEPLLPKGRPVVVDTESEYETDTEDGSWSDEEPVVEENEAQKQEEIKRELALQQERERQEAELQQQEVLLRQMYLQQQQQLQHNTQHHAGRPTAVQRTHSSHYPAPNNVRTNKGAPQRTRHQQIRELALHHAKLEQAAKEAQRQRDMIKKLPRESFQDLAKSRANSVGLLSQLLKPSPEIPPPSQPYRRGDGSDAIQPMGLGSMAAIQPTTSDPGPCANPNPVAKLPPNHNPYQSTQAPQTETTRPPPPRRHMSTDEGRRRMSSLSKITPPIRGPPLQLTKSSAALPVSSQVQVGSVSTKGATSAAVTSGVLGNLLTMTASGGYRPKRPLKDHEMEEESDSEPDTGKIQISKSIAEQKLKALAEKRGGIRQQQVVGRPQPQAGPSKVAPPADEDVPDWARVSQPDRQQGLQHRPMNGLQITPLSRPLPPPSAPIPLAHPYNLPAPPPPTTPRTTRRQMLATELSESLRRNLLWERQISKNNLAAMRRSSSGVANHHDGLGRMQPFVSIAPVVQLHAKGTIPLDQQEDPAKRPAAPMTEAEREELKKYAVARNRSWANEFHYAGW